jgi:putative transposase
VTFIDGHRDRWGVEPICRVLRVAPSTYYTARSRPPSARVVRDAQLKVEIERVYKANFSSMGPARSGGSFTGRASSSAVTGSPG